MKPTNHKAIATTDVVLVYIENNPTFFARVENISPDVKKGWWRVQLLVLQIPLIVTTWILDNDQICGADFTMGGTPMRIEKIVAPSPVSKALPNQDQEHDIEGQDRLKHQARIISLNPNIKK